MEKTNVPNEGADKNAKIAYAILGIAFLAIALIILIVIIPGMSQNNPNEDTSKMTDDVSLSIPSKEERVNEVLAKSIYNLIPDIYEEGRKPFSSHYMLNIAVSQIMTLQGNEAELSYSEVNEEAKTIFGTDANIVKEEVTAQDAEKSIFYYNPSTDKFDIIPMGFGYVFKSQELKYVTKKEDTYYLYNYLMSGNYEIEFGGEEGMDINKVTLIIGDKEGKDLVQTFSSIAEMSDTSYWIGQYADKLPVIKYTLEQDKENTAKYYVTEVEQIIQ